MGKTDLKEIKLKIKNVNQKIDEVLLRPENKANDKIFDTLLLELNKLVKERNNMIMEMEEEQANHR